MTLEPSVTIVVVPRERISLARQCLESLYAHTDIPFRLVWVDGGSPPRTSRYLRDQARARGFDLVRTDDYLAQWRRVTRPCDADLETVASTEAARLEAEFTDDALAALVRTGGSYV